ncbi:MAG: hypothetical protein JXA67_22170 [Micromonosporaceae bacterium]|nr:hypothetical protein [Micromonosporaceae bacterium]
MSTDTTANSGPVATPSPPSQHQPTGSKRRARLVDLAVLAAFGLLGVWLTSGLYPDPGGLHVAGNRQDSVQLQWLLLHATRLFTHGENPLFTTLINAPYGVNLMANTSILAFAIPLVPITLAFGPEISALILLTLAPAATATAWYCFLSRHVVRSRLAAFVGALLAGFAPAMVSHSTGHPNIVAQFLLPFIVLTVLRIRVPGRAVRTGLELAGLVIVQIFINEEILFLTAVTLLLFILVIMAFRPNEIIPHVRAGLITAGVTAAVAGAVTAYPLWHQFFGPMAYRGLPTFVLEYGNDLASFPAFASESLAGPSDNITTISANLTEQNAFYGWPLLALLVLIAIQLRRELVARALLLTGLVLAALSLGQEILIGGKPTGVPGPWALVSRLPLFDSVVPTRLTLFVTPLIAILLALSLDRAVPVLRAWRDQLAGTMARAALPLAWPVVVLAALAPIAPTPIDVAPDTPSPRFFTTGAWRDHIPAGGTVLPVPLGWDENVDVMQWQLDTDLALVAPCGYYLAPAPTGSDRTANFGPVNLAVVDQLLLVGQTGSMSVLTLSPEATRQELRTWKVDALVLPDSSANAGLLRTAVEQLVGKGTHVEDVWVWASLGG